MTIPVLMRPVRGEIVGEEEVEEKGQRD